MRALGPLLWSVDGARGRRDYRWHFLLVFAPQRFASKGPTSHTRLGGQRTASAGMENNLSGVAQRASS